MVYDWEHKEDIKLWQQELLNHKDKLIYKSQENKRFIDIKSIQVCRNQLAYTNTDLPRFTVGLHVNKPFIKKGWKYI